MQQNYSNHRRYVPGFHYVLSTMIIVVFVTAIIHTIHLIGSCHAGNCSSNGCCCWFYCLKPQLVSLILIMLYWYSRKFAVQVQDRAIRAEENMRHFNMTGKPLDPRLTIGQIVALRFAGDNEYLSLTERAINEQMKPNGIKKAIKNWRGDYNRC